LERLQQQYAKLVAAKRRLRAVKKDPTEAIEWLRKAADQKHLNALCDLGDMYLQGEGMEPNSSEALRCYSAAADDDWDYHDWDPDVFLYMWEKAADLGHAKSQHLCAQYR